MTVRKSWLERHRAEKCLPEKAAHPTGDVTHRHLALSLDNFDSQRKIENFDRPLRHYLANRAARAACLSEAFGHDSMGISSTIGSDRDKLAAGAAFPA